jgi:hypothetical protein
VIVIQLAVVVAVQLHPVAALTVKLPVPALDVGLADVGETVGEQVAPDWFTVNVMPPTDTVPTRDVVAVFAATVYENVPLPVPVAPAVTVIQASLAVAAHPHPVDALMVTMLEAPEAAAVDDDGDSAETHETPT